MRDRIKERLTEYQAEALESIAAAENRTRADFGQRGIFQRRRLKNLSNSDEIKRLPEETRLEFLTRLTTLLKSLKRLTQMEAKCFGD